MLRPPRGILRPPDLLRSRHSNIIDLLKITSQLAVVVIAVEYWGNELRRCLMTLGKFTRKPAGMIKRLSIDDRGAEGTYEAHEIGSKSSNTQFV
jgi:hypothetical protein